MDESENQEEGPLGRHSGHTARNGLASATLPVRVVTALSVNAPNPAPLLPPCFLPYTCTSHAVHPCFSLFLLRFHPYPPSLLFFPSLIYAYIYNIYIYTLYTLRHFVTSRSNRCHSARNIRRATTFNAANKDVTFADVLSSFLLPPLRHLSPSPPPSFDRTNKRRVYRFTASCEEETLSLARGKKKERKKKKKKNNPFFPLFVSSKLESVNRIECRIELSTIPIVFHLSSFLPFSFVLCFLRSTRRIIPTRTHAPPTPPSPLPKHDEKSRDIL